MSKQPKPFEYKGKKKTRLPRESLWRDGLSFSKMVEVGGVEPENGDFQNSDKPSQFHDNSSPYHIRNDKLTNIPKNYKVEDIGLISDTEKHIIDSLRAQYKHNGIPEEFIKLIKVWPNIPESVSRGILAMVDCYL